MPTYGFDEDRNESRRIRAWQSHYMAKGCNSTKARTVALKKVRQSSTWPGAAA